MNEITSIEKPGELELFERMLRLNVADGQASPRTLENYRQSLAAYFSWCKGAEIDPRTATYDHLQGYRAWLCAAGYKHSTIRLRLLAARILYRAMQRWGMRPDNPAEGVKTPRNKTSEGEAVKRKALSPEEVRKLIGCLPPPFTVAGARDRALVMLMLFQGLRAYEATRLTLGDLDTKSYSWLDVVGKGQKRRRLLLVPGVRQELMAWVQRRGTYLDNGALFHRLDVPGADFLTVRSLERIVDKYLTASGLKTPGRSAHSLRHTYAVLCVLGGAERERLADSMGHAHLGTTDIYIRAAADFQDNPAEAAWRAANKPADPGADF